MKSFFHKKDIAEIVKNLGDTACQFEGKTILLTGGQGFLGCYFTETLLFLNRNVFKNPCRIIAVDNFITASGPYEEEAGLTAKGPNYCFFKHDVVQPLPPQIDDRFDYILHTAGVASPFYYQAYPLQTLDVAVLGTRHLLNLAKQHEANMLFFSSSEIYGDPPPNCVPTPESYRGNVSCLDSRACYDESKRLGETLCRIYHTQFGVHTNIVRPFNVYGPGMHAADYRVLSNFASCIQNQQPLHVYGSGNQTRTFCYITDAIAGFLKVLVHGVPGEPYNIGNPVPEISILELARMIQEVLGQELQIRQVNYPDAYPADEPLRRCPDITKAARQLGFEPSVKIRDGLQRFFDWTAKTTKPESRKTNVTTAPDMQVALIGAGRWGQTFVKAIRKLNGMALCALASRNPAATALVGPDVFVTDDYRQLFNRSNIDGIIIATAASTHFDILSNCMEAGFPCIVEKPLAMQYADAEKLLAIEQACAARVLVDHIHLYNPAWRSLKLKKTELGAVAKITSSGGNSGPERPDCNALWDYGPHDLALSLDLMGTAPTDVSCTTAAAGNFQIALRFENGTTADILVGNRFQQKTRRFEVLFETQGLIFDDLAASKLVSFDRGCPGNNQTAANSRADTAGGTAGRIQRRGSGRQAGRVWLATGR